MSFFYTFPAVRGVQANTEYYISMVPLNLLNRLFPDEQDIVQPEFRAQRKINEARIPEIRDYILKNTNSYVFSALSASIDGDFRFEASSDCNEAGNLIVDMNASFLINDGQHRKAAIVEAIKECSELGKETISIVFFRDKGLKKSQQMFTDLNKHAVKTSNSLSTLYDERDPLSKATKEVINKIPFFKKYTDLEKDNLGKNSMNLFTLNAFHKANLKILHNCNPKDEEFLLRYWRNVADNIFEWRELENKQITKKDLRENYIITLNITILAFGKLGKYFNENKNIDLEEKLKKLETIDWRRNNTDWVGAAIREDGKVLNSEEGITKTYIKIKEKIGL